MMTRSLKDLLDQVTLTWKRHQIPLFFGTTNALTTMKSINTNNNDNNQYGARSRFSQILMFTCVVAFVLQMLGATISFTNVPTNLEPYMLENFAQQPNVNTVLDDSTADEIAQRKLSQTPEVSSSASQVALAKSPRHGPEPHSGRLRVLWGILSADFFNDQVYRKRHRDLFKLWNDPRVCSLPNFRKMSKDEQYQCQLVYTFVLGSNPDAPPQLLDNSRPMEVTGPVKGKGPDLNNPDITHLNIRENMNEGKSQTWMKYGAEIAEQYDLDYVVKCDADSMLHLHEFFHFAYKNMPPAPYNRGMYVGALRDKAYWPRHSTEKERIQYESFFGNNFEGVHLYIAGQLYIVSKDVAKFIGKEALEGNCTYCEGHEDHDITTMAFHSPEPLKLTVIGRHQRFWEHPVKGEPRWRRIWARENARMSGHPFEDKVFTTDSSLESVLGSQLVANAVPH